MLFGSNLPTARRLFSREQRVSDQHGDWRNAEDDEQWRGRIRLSAVPVGQYELDVTADGFTQEGQEEETT
jgi:hypothetical protein